MPAMNVNVQQTTFFALEEAVRRTGWDKNRITDEALTKYLEELAEDEELTRLADEAYKRYLESGEKAIPAEEVYAAAGF